MKTGDKTLKLLKLSRIKLEQLIDCHVRTLEIGLRELDFLLENCNKEGHVVRKNIFSLTSFLYHPTFREPFSKQPVINFLEPITITYQKFIEMQKPRHILRRTTRSCETTHYLPKHKKNQRLFAIDRIILDESISKDIKYIVGEKAEENLENCLPTGDFFHNHVWLGKIGKIGYLPLTGPIDNEIIDFQTYLQKGKPRYIIETKNTTYQPLHSTVSPLTLTVSALA